MKKEKNSKGGTDSTQKSKTIIGVIICVILIPILVFNCILLVKSFVDPEHVPGVGGKFPLIVMSDSMYPMFERGDMLICKKTNAEDLKEGDVIAYYFRTDDPENDKGFVVVAHRITDISEEDGQLMFTTMGDANATEDPEKVAGDDILGVYERHIKGLGRVAMFMQTTPGLIICVILPILLIIGVDVLRRRRYERTSESETEKLLAELEELRALKEAGNKDNGTDK